MGVLIVGQGRPRPPFIAGVWDLVFLAGFVVFVLGLCGVIS